jgi:RNA processing factor Prp31
MATVTRANENLFHQAISAWESAVDSGVKMQEECADWMRKTCCDPDSLNEWYQEGQAVAGETLAKTQESFDEAMKVFNQQVKANAKLLQKTLETRQGENAAEAQHTYREWWETALETMRTNNQEVLKANSHLLKAWSELSQKFNGKANEAMANMVQKTAEQADKMTKSATEHILNMVKKASGN